MKRMGFVSALLLCGALSTGCSDGGLSFEEIQLALGDCSQETAGNLMHVLLAIGSVPEYISSEGNAPYPGFDVVSVGETAPGVWDFAVVFDTNGNGIPDTTVNGTATYSGDPFNILPGDTIHIVFQIQDSILAGPPADQGRLTGSGDIVATIGETEGEASITGVATIHDSSGDGCDAELTFPEAAPLVVTFFTAPALAAATPAVDIFGTVEALIETIGHALNATLTFTDGDQTVDVAGDIDGTEVDLGFELLPSNEVINAFFECAGATFEQIDFMTAAYEAVAAGALGGSPPPGVTVTPAGTNLFNYAVNLATFDPSNFTAGTITGRASLLFPTVSGIEPSGISVTWTITNATNVDGTIVSGRNTTGRALNLFLAGPEITSFAGAGTLDISAPSALSGGAPTMDCAVSFDVPATDPVDFGTSGKAILDITVDADAMNLVIDFDEELVLITINGVPVPFLIPGP